MSHSPTFTISYCHNCDGGLQEYMSAAQACRELFPDATIVGQRRKAFPIEVTVTAHVSEGQAVQVWSGEQQSLFKKYEHRRTNTLCAIRENLQKLQTVF